MTMTSTTSPLCSSTYCSVFGGSIRSPLALRMLISRLLTWFPAEGRGEEGRQHEEEKLYKLHFLCALCIPVIELYSFVPELIWFNGQWTGWDNGYNKITKSALTGQVTLSYSQRSGTVFQVLILKRLFIPSGKLRVLGLVTCFGTSL